MEYETVLVIDEETGETRYDLISRTHQPVDIDRSRQPTTSKIRMTTVTRRTARHVRVPKISESPSQDTLTGIFRNSSRVPKTLGGTNEFINAFWVKGKPKCAKGYRYDFSRKMCRLIK